MDAGFRRLHGVTLIMNRRRAAREIVYLIDLDIERKCHIVSNQLKILVVKQMFDIGPAASIKIVDANDIRALRQ